MRISVFGLMLLSLFIASCEGANLTTGANEQPPPKEEPVVTAAPEAAAVDESLNESSSEFDEVERSNLDGTPQTTSSLAEVRTSSTQESNQRGDSNSVRTVPAPETGGEGTASSITKDGITWKFDREYQVGQYINGDWWVLGPVSITSISPGWDGVRHGSQVNPLPGNTGIDRPQGYHTQAPDYRSEANVAENMPFDLNAGDSLVSTIGWSKSDPGAPTHSTGLRPDVRAASVLTVVGQKPSSDEFRPQYSGGSKDVYRWSDVNMGLLPKLSKEGISDIPSLAKANDNISKPMIDHLSYWNGREIHPSENMEDYGRDLSVEMNEASLLLMLDFSDSEKRDLTLSLIQRGIDLHGLLKEAPSIEQNGSKNGWWGDFGGGHGNGRKWPILFAGIMLDDTQMKSIGKDYSNEFFQEDCQIRRGDSGVKMVTWTGGGMEWGEFLCTRPTATPSDNSSSYRTCCTGNVTNGAALSALLMDGHNPSTNAAGLWNNDVFFDYNDYYMDSLSHSKDWQRSFSGFTEQMWDKHR